MSAPESPWLIPYDYQPRTRLVYGLDAVEGAGRLAAQIGARRSLLVTDPGLVAAGHARRLQAVLQAAGLSVAIFDQVRQNPTTACVDRCLEVARRANIDTIVALGGGSAMDTAKGCNFILTNGGVMRDFWGAGKAKKPMLPLIAIPTTAGTGSETQSFALIADEKTHQKMACGDPKAAAAIAILDPRLTLSQPFRITACTGIDAVAHAVESAVTRRRNSFSLMFAHEAFKLGVTSLPIVLREPNEVEARGRMQLAAALAGLAIENSMLGAAHAAANPLTARFDVVHGEAVGIMLPHVVRFNAKFAPARKAYAELASAPEIACVSDGLEPAVDALVARLESLLNQANIPRSLESYAVDRRQIPAMAEEAAQQWTASFNPRPIAAADFVRLYETAFALRGPGDRA